MNTEQKKQAQERFSFNGTLIEPICVDCLNINGKYCLAFNKERNDETVSLYIHQRNCPNYEKKDLIDLF